MIVQFGPSNRPIQLDCADWEDELSRIDFQNDKFPGLMKQNSVSLIVFGNPFNDDRISIPVNIASRIPMSFSNEPNLGKVDEVLIGEHLPLIRNRRSMEARALTGEPEPDA